MENKERAEKKQEIREYSIRENVFFTTLIAAQNPDLFRKMHKSEVMALVIEIAEQFENEHPDGSVEELEEYAKAKLRKVV